MAEVLAEGTRGTITELRHFGDIVVCNSSGELLYTVGDPEFVTFFRSTQKPLMGINLFLSGAAKRWHFTQKEYAIMCSSHYGMPIHQEVIMGLLDKIGITLYDLKTGKPYSFYPSYREKQLKENQEMKQYNSDCSGKHIAFIAECIALNYPMEGYDSPEHPIQKDILKLISDITRIPERDIVVGNDGCGVPVHAVPIKNMAMAYARFTTPENLPKEYRDGAKIIAESMCNEPDMIAAPGDFCTELLRVTKGKFIGKLGANGLFLVGVRGRDMGIAVKIEDGDVFTALYPVVMSTLDQLGLLSDEEKSALKDFSETPLLSDHGTVVGNVRPVFKLRRP